MMTNKSRNLAVLLTLLVPLLVQAQETPAAAGEPVKGSSELNLTWSDSDALLRRALQNNPDIIAARSAVVMAEAELNRTRQQVTRQVLEAANKLAHAEKLAEQTQRRLELGTATLDDTLKVQNELIELREALRYLVGTESAARQGQPAATSFEVPALVRKARPEYTEVLPEQFVHELRSQVGITFEEIRLTDILTFISDSYDVGFIVDVALPQDSVKYLTLRNVSLYDALLSLADQNEDVCFVLRDYGLFATTRERAQRINAPSIPPDIPLYVPADEPEGN